MCLLWTYIKVSCTCALCALVLKCHAHVHCVHLYQSAKVVMYLKLQLDICTELHLYQKYHSMGPFSPKSLSQVPGLTFVIIHSPVKPVTCLRPLVNPAPGNNASNL